MAQQIPNTWKRCATCAFWTGSRQCDFFGQIVTIENAMTKGKCAIPYGGWKGYEKQANASCTSWQKWPVLR